MAELKTGAVLREWLDRALGPMVLPRTQGVTHGGTLLTLRGIKDTTKDVDFAFLDRKAFASCGKALIANKYNLEADFQPWPGETYRRYRNPSETVDLVDLRHPTWNSWAMKGAALRGCERFFHGNFELLLPDVETSFVFKTYPCRPADISDMGRILEKVPTLNWARIRQIFEEQEEFAAEKKAYSPVLLVAESRGRAFASSGVLLDDGERRIKEFHSWARERWRQLGLPKATPQQTIEEIRKDQDGEAAKFPWRDRLHNREAQIARTLGLERKS